MTSFVSNKTASATIISTTNLASLFEGNSLKEKSPRFRIPTLRGPVSSRAEHDQDDIQLHTSKLHVAHHIRTDLCTRPLLVDGHMVCFHHEAPLGPCISAASPFVCLPEHTSIHHLANRRRHCCPAKRNPFLNFRQRAIQLFQDLQRHGLFRWRSSPTTSKSSTSKCSTHRLRGWPSNENKQRTYAFSGVLVLSVSESRKFGANSDQTQNTNWF